MDTYAKQPKIAKLPLIRSANHCDMMKCMVVCCSTILSFPVGNFGGLAHIWNVGGTGSSRFVVGGYTRNIFAITDIASDYEYVCLDTGGRQRALCVSGMPQASRDFPTDSLFAVCENRSDGRNDIMTKTINPSNRDFPP